MLIGMCTLHFEEPWLLGILALLLAMQPPADVQLREAAVMTEITWPLLLTQATVIDFQAVGFWPGPVLLVESIGGGGGKPASR